MKNFVTALVGGIGILAASASAAEPFKGDSNPKLFDFSATTGLGLIDSQAAWTLQFSGARRLIERGFVSDINDQVFGEVQLGPAVFDGKRAMTYSFHLRWDFEQDSQWRFFAVGGFGGNATGADFGNRWTLFPRFGIGLFYEFGAPVSIRAEISHEQTLVGVSYRM